MSKRTGRLMVGDTAVQLLDDEVHLNKRGILIYSDVNNSDIIWVGYDSGMTADQDNDMDGFPIYPGNTLEVELADAKLLFVRSTASGNQKIWFIML